MHKDDIVEVYIAADAPQAYFLRNMLVDAGITAEVLGGTVSSSLGSRRHKHRDMAGA